MNAMESRFLGLSRAMPLDVPVSRVPRDKRSPAVASWSAECCVQETGASPSRETGHAPLAEVNPEAQKPRC